VYPCATLSEALEATLQPSNKRKGRKSDG